MTTPIVNKAIVQKIVALSRKGFVHGLGKAKPGKMCVEAAVCFAFGEPHDDKPKCVDNELSDLKISINDTRGWPNKKARGKGLRALAIAQLGTKGTLPASYTQFVRATSRALESTLVPILLRDLPRVRDLEDRNTVRDQIAAVLKAAKEDGSFSWNKQSGLYADLDVIAGLVGSLSYFPRKFRHRYLLLMCKAIVAGLVKVKTEGSKFLYLTRR